MDETIRGASIAFVIKSICVTKGGAERILIETLNCLVAEGRDDILLITFDRYDDQPRYKLNPNLRWVRLGSGPIRSYSFRDILLNTWAIRKASKQFKIVNFVGFMSSSFVLLMLARCVGGAKFCCCEHIDLRYYKGRKIELWASRWAMRFAEKNIFISADQLSERGIIRNSLLIENFTLFRRCCRLRVQSNPLKILTVGRFEIQKNLDMCLKVADLLKHSNFEFSWSVVGSGSLEESFKTAVESKQFGSQFRIEPYVDDIENYYLDHDLLVLPSIHESFGLVALEALQRGLPVISYSDLKEVSKFVVDGKYGYLVKRDNTGLSLVRALYKFVESHEALLANLNAEQVLFKTYTIKNAKNKWTALLDCFLKSDENSCAE